MSVLVGWSWQKTDNITRGFISHVRLIRVQQTDMEKSILPNQSCQINLAKSNSTRSTQLTANLARLTSVGLHSSVSTLVVNTNQVPLPKGEE